MPRSISLAAALIIAASPLYAQQPQQQTQEKSSVVAPVVVKSMADGMVHGQMLAEQQGTGGSMAGGLAGGVLLGLIGTAIAYVAQGPAELPAVQLVEAQKYGSEYTLGLQQGFAEKSKKKKKNAALAGGLLGTAAWIAVIAGAQ
jgi:hypothetical protein